MTRLAVLGFALALGAGPAAAAGPASESCAAPPALITIAPPLIHSAVRIEHARPLTIVAVGSSSTQGVGASAPPLSYPSRLEAEIRDRVPDAKIRVLNRGKGGEDAGEELARLESDVVAERPQLVIWQVGTNAVLRRDDLAADGEVLRRGVTLLKESGADVVLMDMQYAPRVIERPAYAAMEQLIADTAEHSHVGLFRRFALMQHWQAAHQPDQPMMIGADGLHMTDAGYGCLAADLAEALAWNWWSHQSKVEQGSGTADKLAGLGRPQAATH